MMTIFSWNVNGIRAVERKGFPEWLQQSGADIVALQETKAAPEQLSTQLRQPAAFYSAWCTAEKPGYSGVATFSRHQPERVQRGFGDNRFDKEGRVLIARFADFDFYNIYFPSGTSGPERISYKLAFYERFLEFVGPQLNAGRPLIVAGDVNTAYAEIDLARPKQNVKNSGFLPEEREMLSRFFAAGLVDSFRHHRPADIAYSWWSLRSDARARNVGWRLDYIFVSQNLADRIVGAATHPEITGSDHCPISVQLDL
jgi:exodeoxyribonuclease III